MRQKIEIEVWGDEEGDIDLARREAFAAIEEGFIFGGDRNDTGGYNYEVTDVEEDE